MMSAATTSFGFTTPPAYSSIIHLFIEAAAKTIYIKRIEGIKIKIVNSSSSPRSPQHSIIDLGLTQLTMAGKKSTLKKADKIYTKIMNNLRQKTWTAWGVGRRIVGFNNRHGHKYKHEYK